MNQIKMHPETISEIAAHLLAPSTSLGADVLKNVVKKSAEIWSETRRQVNERAPDLLVHLPPEDHEMQPIVERIARNAATIYPTANVPDTEKVKTVVSWAAEIYKLSRTAVEPRSAAQNA